MVDYPLAQFGTELSRLGTVYNGLYEQYNNLLMGERAVPTQLLLMVDEVTPILVQLKAAVARLGSTSQPVTGLPSVVVPDAPASPKAARWTASAVPADWKGLTGAGTPTPSNPSELARLETGATRGGSKGGSGGSGDLGGDDSLKHGVGGNGVGGIYQLTGYGQRPTSHGWGAAQGSPLVPEEVAIPPYDVEPGQTMNLADLTSIPLPPVDAVAAPFTFSAARDTAATFAATPVGGVGTIPTFAPASPRRKGYATALPPLPR